MNKAELAEHLVEYLNDLLQRDRPAIAAMITNRFPCNAAMADHPTCQVALQNGGFDVGLLGLLNGLCKYDPDAHRHDPDNFGPVVAVFSGGEHPTDLGTLERFEVYQPPSQTPAQSLPCSAIIDSSESNSDAGVTHPFHVIVATDNGSGEQALYVGGDLRSQDGTLHACDIANAVGDNVFQFTAINVDRPNAWPKRFEELLGATACG